MAGCRLLFIAPEAGKMGDGHGIVLEGNNPFQAYHFLSRPAPIGPSKYLF